MCIFRVNELVWPGIGIDAEENSSTQTNELITVKTWAVRSSETSEQ